LAMRYDAVIASKRQHRYTFSAGDSLVNGPN
jgi:hypothetical protein